MKRPIVGVIGTAKADDQIRALAFEVGELLARRGCTIITGGLGGVMEASCAGFQQGSARLSPEERGVAVGVLPGQSVESANVYVDMPIATGMDEARNCVIVNTAHVCIAIGGGFGTLSEVALALRQKKRVISLSSWVVDPAIERADSPEDAVIKALAGLA